MNWAETHWAYLITAAVLPIAWWLSHKQDEIRVKAEVEAREKRRAEVRGVLEEYRLYVLDSMNVESYAEREAARLAAEELADVIIRSVR